MQGTYRAARQAGDPRSPWFARMASDYLDRGEAEKALRTCLAGRREFPRYLTGSLVLGKCYEAVGRRLEAMMEFQRVLEGVPGNPVVLELLHKAEKREREEFLAFAERRGAELGKERNSRSFESYVADRPPKEESGVDFLLKQLQAVQKKGLPEGGADAAHELHDADEPTGKIVTATLAEIYAGQKQYREAVAAYQRLLEQRPEEAGRYGKRLAELEELARRETPGQPQ